MDKVKVTQALNTLPDAILTLNLNSPKADLLEVLAREIALYGREADRVQYVVADPHGYNILASSHEEVEELYVGLPSLAPTEAAKLVVDHSLPKDTFLLVRWVGEEMRVVRVELERTQKTTAGSAPA